MQNAETIYLLVPLDRRCKLPVVIKLRPPKRAGLLLAAAYLVLNSGCAHLKPPPEAATTDLPYRSIKGFDDTAYDRHPGASELANLLNAFLGSR